jgi:hypothetical protein
VAVCCWAIPAAPSCVTAPPRTGAFSMAMTAWSASFQQRDLLARELAGRATRDGRAPIAVLPPSMARRLPPVIRWPACSWLQQLAPEVVAASAINDPIEDSSTVHVVAHQGDKSAPCLQQAGSESATAAAINIAIQERDSDCRSRTVSAHSRRWRQHRLQIEFRTADDASTSDVAV